MKSVTAFCLARVISFSQIQNDVIEELKWDPAVTHAHIGVAVNNGIVSLTGHVPSYMKKFSAAKAAQRVAGVQALFLDEIGDMSPVLQTKILRVIQERQLRAVGENSQHSIDVRIIAATHRDLKSEIHKGRFREDLYYRLSVVPVAIPPLRKRKEDIPVLIQHFLGVFSQRHNSPRIEFTRSAMAKLISRPWKGNVRELENFIERIVVMNSGHALTADQLSLFDDETDPEAFYRQSTDDFPTLEQLEKRYISLVLQKTSGRRDKAASILGINRRTLYRKVKEYHFEEDASIASHSEEKAPREDAEGNHLSY